MAQSSNPKTSKPQASNQANGKTNRQTGGRATRTASASAVAIKEKPALSSRPSSTGSPLLDSFITHTAEEIVFIPNPKIVGSRRNTRPHPSRHQFNHAQVNLPASFRENRSIVLSTELEDAPIKSASERTVVKRVKPASSNSNQAAESIRQTSNGQKPQPTAKAKNPSNTASENRNSVAQGLTADQAIAKAVDAAKSSLPQRRQPTEGKISLRPQGAPSQGAPPQRTPQKPLQRAPQKTPHRTPQQTPQQPPRRTPGASPKVSAPSGPKVYGGSDYKALQARAAAGGLVDLEDTLLFGGADNKSAASKRKNAPIGAEESIATILEFLTTQPSEFTLTKPEGNRAILDDFSHLERPDFIETKAVIDARTFTVVEPVQEPKNNAQTLPPQSGQNGANGTQELKHLTQQIDQLHQRIEYLSKRLASLDNGQKPTKPANSTHDTDFSTDVSTEIRQEPAPQSQAVLNVADFNTDTSPNGGLQALPNPDNIL